MSRRTFIASIALIVAIGVVRVATTDRVFAQVIDEPVHVAAGYGWLADGTYNVDIEHPPLARAIIGLPLWLSGATAPASTAWVERGNALLLYGGRYVHNLQLARTGNLFFLALAIATAALWASHLGGEVAGIIAALIVASLPPMLAHAGIATTDLAAAATIPFALYALTRWLDAPIRRRAVVLGIAIGIGLLAKFSFLLFFPAGAIVVIAFRARRISLRHIALIVAIAAVLVLAVYRFDLAPLVRGIIAVQQHNARGHSAYLFGEVRNSGWWDYFPIAILFKTPLGLLILGMAALFTRAREGTLIALAILAVAMTSSINIGVRHVLPVYVPLAVAAAIFALRFRLFAGILVAWIVVNSVLAHPDYLAWFNELARDHPERILIDSNLDWGQDILRLRRVMRDEHVSAFTEFLFTSADLDRLGFPPHQKYAIGQPARGWIAISETPYQMMGGDESLAWSALSGKPFRRVGKSIRLYDLR